MSAQGEWVLVSSPHSHWELREFQHRSIEQVACGIHTDPCLSFPCDKFLDFCQIKFGEEIITSEVTKFAITGPESTTYRDFGRFGLCEEDRI